MLKMFSYFFFTCCFLLISFNREKTIETFDDLVRSDYKTLLKKDGFPYNYIKVDDEPHYVLHKLL